MITELQRLPPEQLGPGATYRIIANPQRIFLKTGPYAIGTGGLAPTAGGAM